MPRRAPAQLVAALVLFPALLTACSREPAVPAPTAATAVADLELRVPSMHCDGCEMAIESSVARIPGVVTCDADFETGSVKVGVSDPEVTEAVIAAIEKLEYPVER